jgi:hypothetical protein
MHRIFILGEAIVKRFKPELMKNLELGDVLNPEVGFYV